MDKLRLTKPKLKQKHQYKCIMGS